LPAFDPAAGAYVVRHWARPVTELSSGRFGVREPDAGCHQLPVPELDLRVVPGVAFGQSGSRIGRGKGYFDRLLSRSTVAVSCGVGFDEQLLPVVPVESHDVQLAYILTPSRVVDCRALGL
jgi:5-formyltetrahydrofolate cyclo-ligase